MIPRTGRKGRNRCNAPLNLKAPLSGHALNPFSQWLREFTLRLARARRGRDRGQPDTLP